MQSSEHETKSSRIPCFSKASVVERRNILVEQGFLLDGEADIVFSTGGLPQEHASSFVENCIGGFSLPLGVALNFVVDGIDVLVPMAVEESSVVAAASHGAKLARELGGFFSSPTQTIATAQVEVFVDNENGVLERIEALRERIFEVAESKHPRLLERGGGARAMEVRRIAPNRFVIHLHVDTLEAMGANIVNTMAEEVGRCLPQWMPCEVGLRILTNLTTHRVTKVYCEIEPKMLAQEGFSGEIAVERIVRAWEFAFYDPFRAATHNKGVMNGIDPVVIATGNDWRAVESGCHAYAALSGSYKPLTHWSKTESGHLRGEIAVPIAVGTVGGVTKLHPTARASLRLLGAPSSARLSAVIASVGLAQNLSALRALACEGIQKGHMGLHQRNLEMMSSNGAAANVPVGGNHG
jgi:hydroxymethylglutaryl-CoA reductase